uniref:Ubiquitin-like protease family profile domain-containing protein n=1 Tax=Globodera rostochiensis TaxID=31243 RepID=A0A914HRB0_GLORO
MSESSDNSVEEDSPMHVEKALREVNANLKLDDAPTTANNVNKIINFNTVHMNFATTRNANCKIRFNETCWNKPDEWLNDGFITVYLAYLASISKRKVVVVDSLVSTPATAVVRRSSFKNYTFGYDPNNAAEVILMPLNFPNHWTLLVHDVAVGTFFADSLHTSRMDSARSELIKDIIVDIVPIERSSIVIEKVNNLTPQQDGFSCGYFACLYAEAWLMSPKTFIKCANGLR